MILCATRKGPFGVEAVNAYVETALKRMGFIRETGFHRREWYPGRPVLITRNNYDLGLFNGDIGITLPDQSSTDGRLYVFFSGSEGDVRRFLPSRLSDHETAFAMTVHKSQGSEFDHVLLVLPDRDSPLLTKELVYTGITRARKEVTLWGSETIIRTAVSRKIKRASGLKDALWS
jgi:exodeoxyribonuclease V alpha subunit